MKKDKRQQIFKILDEQGYILDNQTVDIFGDESGCYKALKYVRMWRRLNHDTEFFQGKKIVEKYKACRKHLVRLQDQEHWYQVGKEFYETITL